MIIRVIKKDSPYVMLDKTFINDKRLSYKCLGIMTYLLSKPDGWHVRVGDLVNQHTDGRDAVRSGIKELTKYGYMQPQIKRDPNTGLILKYDYDVFERPVNNVRPVTGFPKVDNPVTGFPEADNPEADNPPLLINELSNKGLIIKNDINNLTHKRDHNNNNSRNGKSKQKNVVVVPCNKKEFETIKKDLLIMGWLGPMEDIVNAYNADPEYIRAVVKKVSKIDGKLNRAGLIRNIVRSGTRIMSREDLEKYSRQQYLDDPYYYSETED